jgi:hypothetical protein
MQELHGYYCKTNWASVCAERLIRLCLLCAVRRTNKLRHLFPFQVCGPTEINSQVDETVGPYVGFAHVFVRLFFSFLYKQILYVGV